MMINCGIIIMHRLYKKYHGDNFFIHNEIYCYEGKSHNRTYVGDIESKEFILKKAYNMLEYKQNVKGIIMLESNIIRLKEKELI